MSERHQSNGNPLGSGSSVAVGFLLGAVVGAGIALLLAPGSGKETRRRVADAGRRWRDEARDVASDLKHEVKSALDAGREELKRGQTAYEAPLATNIERKV